ncbi:hypothetical protein EDB84DRAFT_1278398 [Lactarius hengduanensis]|nr:hypothetical protein EDB84DRAFT_1278398 [Lactarius hengduanensis]
MVRSGLYVKGYKIDREKIRARFPRDELDTATNYELSYYKPILEDIPDTVYQYIGCGREPNGEIIVVLVLEDGYDRSALEANDIVAPDTLIGSPVLSVLTPGVWPSW